MYATILSVIRKGPKNSRYLILTENNEYGSMVAANEKYNLGDYSKIEEKIDSNVKNSWLNTYYNWANTKQKILIHLAKYKKEKLGIEAMVFGLIKMEKKLNINIFCLKGISLKI